MFAAKAWAEAFINTLEREGVKPKDGIGALEALSLPVSSLRGAVFGSSAAEKLEALLREGMRKAGVSSPSYTTALRFISLMVKKNAFRHVGIVLDEAKKLLDRKNGIVRVIVEYAAAPFADEGRIRELVKKRTGAVEVDIVMRGNQELVGGYRLRIGDEIIDASVRSQLKKLKAGLAAG